MNNDCSHKLADGKSAIFIDTKRINMIYPRKFYGVCLLCNKSYEFKKLPEDYNNRG